MFSYNLSKLIRIYPKNKLGDGATVALLALDQAILVRIQVSQDKFKRGERDDEQTRIVSASGAGIESSV